MQHKLAVQRNAFAVKLSRKLFASLSHCEHYSFLVVYTFDLLHFQKKRLRRVIIGSSALLERLKVSGSPPIIEGSW